ncbi:MAG: hypothetical protein CMC94_05135 [Flavobacteriales bacterium]|nr:hypothetical protein [Flavobacteriales bacterium]
MPMVVVIKKNAKVLESLIHWVEKAHFLKGHCVPSPEGTHCPICRKKTIKSTEGSSAIENEPMLLLDDEADYASVNTNDAAKRVTRINELLRILLSKFHQKSYVGYTATPFANIFINPESLGDESVEDDLFPRHFIHQIGTPSNYQGPSTFFGPDANCNLIKPIGLITDQKIENFYQIEREFNPDTGKFTRKILDASFSGIPDELKEAIELLKGEGPEDLQDLVMKLGMEIVRLAGVAGSTLSAKQTVRKHLEDGNALQKFKDVVEYQGGDTRVIDNPEKLPTAKHTKKLPAPKRGYVHTIDAGQLARGVQILAHGEGKKFDPAAGVAELCKVGTQMKQGEPLMIIHYNDEKRLSVAMEYFKAAYRLAPKRPNPAPLVVERVA